MVNLLKQIEQDNIDFFTIYDEIDTIIEIIDNTSKLILNTNKIIRNSIKLIYTMCYYDNNCANFENKNTKIVILILIP